MKRRTFDRIRGIVYDTSGISLGERKEALVSARVGKRMRALGIDSYEVYLSYVDQHPEEVVELLDVVATNVTSFFREPEQFEFVAEHLAALHARGQRRFRLWSTACSTGEEPYSLAIVLAEVLRGPDVDMRILGTDISTRALSVARHGAYDARRIEPVPLELRRQYFAENGSGEERVWQVRPEIGDRIVFRRMNLSAPPFPIRGPLDAIFCRNVMIYFDDAVRARLLAECHRLLRPGGLLFVGHAESLAGMRNDFNHARPSVYQRV